MKDLKESRGSRAAAQDHGRPCHCGEDAFRVFDGFSFPVVFLSEDRRVVHANHAARTLFGFDGGTFEDGRFFKELGNINASSPVKNLARGQSTVFDLVIQDRRRQLSYHRLETPFGEAAYLLTLPPLGRDQGRDEESVRRMKHRFNNYLAPVAGKAEIILFALKKGNYDKAEKAANDILRHAEDNEALDGLFDPEPRQESKSITYYVT